MQKYYIFIFLLSMFFGQSQSVFDDYQGDPLVSNINISPKIFKMLSKFKIDTSDAEAQEFISMVQSLSSFRVMSTKNEAIASAMELWVQAQYEQTPLISILNITEQGVNVKFGAIYGEDETTVSRLVMFVKGLQDFIDTKENIQLDTTTSLDYVLLEIQGKINLDQVAKLTSIVEVPGGEYLDALNEN